MKCCIDFSLSDRFDVVEQTVFRLVLCNVKDVRTIVSLLPIYSDEVICNVIKRLVNFQILHADLESRTLSLSESLLAVIEGCVHTSQSLVIPNTIGDELGDSNMYITKENDKRQILCALLPGINVGFLAKSLDFVVHEGRGTDEQ